MAWLYIPPSSGPISPAILAAIADDIQTWGGDVDAAAWGLGNSAFVVLNPGALPGTAYSVSAASWASGTATFTIGSHSIQVGQLVTITSVTPTGYNVAQVGVTAVGGTTIQVPISAGPGTYTSGGTVTVGPVVPADGMAAFDQNNNLRVYRNGAWSGVWNNLTLQNGWTSAGGANPTPGCMITAEGMVYLRGLIAPGTLTDGTPLFTLPAGFRPVNQTWLHGIADNSGTSESAWLLIAATGTVSYYYNGSASFIGLNNSFPTF